MAKNKWIKLTKLTAADGKWTHGAIDSTAAIKIVVKYTHGMTFAPYAAKVIMHVDLAYTGIPDVNFAVNICENDGSQTVELDLDDSKIDSLNISFANTTDAAFSVSSLDVYYMRGSLNDDDVTNLLSGAGSTGIGGMIGGRLTKLSTWYDYLIAVYDNNREIHAEIERDSDGAIISFKTLADGIKTVFNNYDNLAYEGERPTIKDINTEGVEKA